MMKHTHKHNPAAFTIMELMVSIAIVSFMLFLINRIFFDTAEAVSRGIATSKIIANTRTVGEQLDVDISALIGPGSFVSGTATHPETNAAGFMIIVNKKFTNTQYRDGRSRDGIADTTRPVRSDQLCFIAKTNAELSTSPITTPLTAKSLTSFTSSSSAKYARIWYGHVRQIDSNGNLGNTLGGTADSPDKYATDWVLGRQALFLDDSVDSTDIYNNYDNTFWRTLNTSSATKLEFYYAKSDILNVSLIQGTSPGSGKSSVFGIIDQLEDARLSGGTSRGTYKDLLYAPNKFFVFYGPVSTGDLLSTLTIPSIDALSRDAIAQMHPYFMNNVSDFIVEFAGDYNASGAPIDVDVSGNIQWYGLDNGTVPGSIFEDATGSSDKPYKLDSGTGGIGTLADEVYIFRHDDTANWPKMLRIRYRLHDPKGDLLGTADEDDNGIIDDEGQPGKWFEVIIQVPN